VELLEGVMVFIETNKATIGDSCDILCRADLQCASYIARYYAKELNWTGVVQFSSIHFA